MANSPGRPSSRRANTHDPDGFSQLLLNRISKLAAPRPLSDRRIVKVQEYLRRNMHRQVSLSELSSIACLEQHYLATLFKRSTGQTTMRWRRDMRVAEAARLLAAPRALVSTVLQAVGYRHITSLERAFQKVLGMTPRAVRRALREMQPSIESGRRSARADIHKRQSSCGASSSSWY